ncbi:murein L,D-transpeptidase [Adhaeribacter aerolatus]|uniref:Murein L,D-transpeptidase n=1 Tax=Adhaeribacter aerolatus TaxID=670289 RepID=A0A512B3U1_9BACT|nr:L,D-transpeptidase family protein [Adhaeribacter aerolatus]GEO06633.1 murein L,D-transpeptidase [Adhaeribacter aerolatus]
MHNSKDNTFFYLLFLLILAVAFSCGKNKGNKGGTTAERAQEQKAAHTDSAFVETYVRQEPEFKKQRDIVMKFYRDRNFRLGWFKKDKLVPQANTFITVVNRAYREGLNPEDYKVKDFNQLFKSFEAAKGNDSLQYKLKQEIDVALTASYMHYASDFYRGTVNPKELDQIDWSVRKNKIKLNKALETILRERDSRYPYYQFEPLHEDYNRLRTALQQYREIQKRGGWPAIPAVSRLKPGDTAQVVTLLRKRLLPQDRWVVPGPDSNRFTDEVKNAIMDFQMRHGLNPDGSLGQATLKAMNISIDDRIDQIIINMERWRWVPKPKKFEEKHIFVNVPEFMLYARENGKTVLDMKVIVGKAMNSTPVFSDKIEYIVFSPYWNVPNSIIFEEFLPKLQADPGWLERMDMELLNGLGKNAQPISPYSVDWFSVDEKNFKYRIRQRPGPENPLGDVKFIFPNEHEVYLHHTASETLFSQNQRGFSHGCIRVEKPVELARFLLSDQPSWTEPLILEAMHAGEEKYVNLKEKVPVYIVYFTSWVDDKGGVHFRDDIYGHDKILEKEYFN